MLHTTVALQAPRKRGPPPSRVGPKSKSEKKYLSLKKWKLNPCSNDAPGKNRFKILNFNKIPFRMVLNRVNPEKKFLQPAP